MILTILAASSAGLLSAWIFLFVFSSRIRSRLYSCECDLADLQDRHLRTVRRDAAKGRWDKEDELDLKIEAAIPKKKGWTKWPSSAQSENSSAEQ